MDRSTNPAPAHRRAAVARRALGVGGRGALALMVAAAGIRLADVDSEIRSLDAAQGDARPVRGRLAGFDYRPLPASPRGDARAASWPLLAAAGRAYEAFRARPTPQRRRVLGVARLLAGDEDGAVEDLTRAAEEMRGRPEAWSDLAVAHLARAAGGSRPEEHARALEAAGRALAARPGFAPALFNRAAALDGLGLARHARAAWQQAVDEDPASGWASEARQALDAAPPRPEAGLSSLEGELARALESGSDEDVRAAVQGSVEVARLHLDRELDHVHAGGRTRAVRGLRRLGTAFGQVTGDRLVADVARELAHPGADVTGYLAHAGARKRYAAGAWQESRPLFERARRLLVARDSALQGWSEVHLAILDYQSGRNITAHRRLARLERWAARRGQPLLRCRALWVRGLIELVAGRFDEASLCFEEAERGYRGAQDHAHAAFMVSQQGEVLNDLGRSQLGWAKRLEAVRALDLFVDPSRQVTALMVAGDQALYAGWASTARAFAEEAVDRADRSGSPRLMAESRLHLAQALGAAGHSEAAASFQAARARIEALDDPVARQRVLGEYHRILAESLDLGRHPEAVEAAERGSRWLADRGEWARVMALKARLGRWRVGHGQRQSGRADLEEVIALSHRVVQSEPDLRVSHAALSTAAAYEGLLEDELRAGAAPLRLLELAEQRWRLLDFVRAGAPPADAIAELQRRLHPDAAVLCLVPLDDRVIGWVLRKGSVSFRHIHVGRSELDRAVEELQQSLRRSEPGARGLARALAQRMVDPFAAAMGSARRVFVIAAGALASVPFGWLLDAQGQPLGRRWELNMAPSLGFLASAGPRRGDREAPFLAAAFAGEGSDLPPLPSAEAEAGRMAQRFGGQPLLGRRATREEILRLLPDARAFHFAGHAVGHADRPGWSSLVLAGPGSRPAYLTANEIARIDLRSLDLAVLAACQAAATKADYAEGGVTLARAFLAAGARTVVGPLWEVSDREMERLSHALYTEAGGLNRAALMPVLPFDEVEPGIKAMVVFSAEGALAPPVSRKE